MTFKDLEKLEQEYTIDILKQGENPYIEYTKGDIIDGLKKENQELENQQRNFMEWLEDYIDVLKSQQESVEGLDSCEQYTLIALEEILNKYKEIIGGDNNE